MSRRTGGTCRAADRGHEPPGTDALGGRLEGVSQAGRGDVLQVPPSVPHQEIATDPDAPLSRVLARSGQDPVVVNLDRPHVEPGSDPVRRVDDIHS